MYSMSYITSIRVIDWVTLIRFSSFVIPSRPCPLPFPDLFLSYSLSLFLLLTFHFIPFSIPFRFFQFYTVSSPFPCLQRIGYVYGICCQYCNGLATLWSSRYYFVVVFRIMKKSKREFFGNPAVSDFVSFCFAQRLASQ